MIDWLPHVNAALNLTSAALLAAGYVMIKSGREPAHRRYMLSAFAVSILFLISYVTYHAQAGSKLFPRSDYAIYVAIGYYVLLASHVVLAAVVPFLASVTIYLGLRSRRRAHRRLARWTWPMWMYVSASGVLVYLMLYWWFPPRSVALLG